MLAEVFSQGSWKNLIEMEDHLTLDELQLLRSALFDAEHRRNKFSAALKGVDIDEGTDQSDFEEVQRRAEAALSGRSEQEYVFDMIGIEVDDDDE